MLDFIFIIGTSGIGKSTLAENLLAHYKTTCIEQCMIPEFFSRNGVEEMTGELEELTCWENQAAMLFCFHKLGYKNIIASDIDDLRTADIPVVFKGHRYITIKLISTDLDKIHAQMAHRPNGSLIDFELQEKCNSKNILRPLLPNEHLIDIARMNKEQVFQSAVSIIDNANPLIDYEYAKPDKSLFYSWVFANDLR